MQRISFDQGMAGNSQLFFRLFSDHSQAFRLIIHGAESQIPGIGDLELSVFFIYQIAVFLIAHHPLMKIHGQQSPVRSLPVPHIYLQQVPDLR